MPLLRTQSPSRIEDIEKVEIASKAVVMPIQIACQCGHKLNVPDSMAGKAGKCPKCQQIIKVPNGPTGQSKSVVSPSSARPVPSGKVVAVTAPTALDGLFESAGIVERKGKHCPSCDAPMQPSAVICVACGFNPGEGTKIDGFTSSEKKMYGNKQLNEAVNMMAREAETDKRLLATGPPWWFLFSILIGMLVFLGGAIIKMDAGTSGGFSSNPLMARIQRAHLAIVLAASGGLGCVLVANFANIAILVTAFKESTKQGLLCMFAPFYIVYYMFSRIKTMRLFSTVMILITTSILACVLLGLSLPKI
jgi:hypothetical protein